MAGFIFGGENMPRTPQELEQMRAMALAMGRRSGTPQNLGEGIASIGDAILYRAMSSRADKAEKSATDASSKSFADFASDLFGPTTASDTVPDTATTNPVNTTLPPVEGTMENARTGDRASVQNYAGLDLKSGIRAAADSLGVKPEDLATAISYETAGTFDPTKDGPTTKWGKHRGLIQFGEPQAEKYGVNWNDPLNSQLGPDGAVVKYLRDTGVKPGASLMDIYSAINAGGVDREGASDEANGGAPGTVADKVNYQMDGHRQKALALFADPAATTAFDAQPNLTKDASVVPVPDGFEQTDPMEAKPKATVRVAQAMSTVASEKASQAMTILNDPWATPGQKAVAQTFLKRHLDQQDQLAEEERKRSDPAYQMDLEKGRLEIDKLKNPPKARRLTEQEEKDGGLDTTGVYDLLPDGSTKTVQEPKKRNTATVNGRVVDIDTGEIVAELPEQISVLDQSKADLEREKFEADKAEKSVISPADQAKLDLDKEKFEFERTKPTQDIQEYQFYETREKAAGREPLGPLEWDQARRKSSASQINIDNKTEGAFDKKLAEKQAETFSLMADEGINARADVDTINQLEEFLKGQGGMGTGLSAAVSRWGINFEGADDLQAAEAMINKLVPTQRQPGSGTMSDRDVELFKSSLPSLWNQPGGNEKIIGVMRGMAEYKQQQGEIADQVIMGEMTRQEARRELRKLPNPLEEFRKQMKAKKAEIDGYTIEEVPE
jgi:hypothetical protein